MKIIIPLGGLGERFSSCGYKKPKPLINVMGKPIIFWLLDNLNLSKIDTIIIPYNSLLEKYDFEYLLKHKYKNIKFIKLQNQTRGACETILYGLEELNDDDSIICIDGDNFYTCDIITDWKEQNSVFYFDDESETDKYSFIDIENDNIKNIVEKNRISKHANCGAYGFSSLFELKKYCKKVIDLNLRQKNEFYMSSVIKLMIDENIKFIPKKVDTNNYICLGTPFDVRIFCNNCPKISAYNGNTILESKRYCFDLDNTLVSYPKIKDDYTSVEPIQKNINMLKYLKKLGHTIIIHTARRMKTHNGNTGKILADVGKITLDTLEKFDIPYDEIYFGKPYADTYIDDSAVSAYDDLEKELGFYKSNIDTRSFNTLQYNIIHTYTKTGKDLSGEIYWYEHIPESIKDMFPLFIRKDNNNYVMEKINGIPFSKLFLSEEMTIEHLKHIMNSIDRIHNSENINLDINIYGNYYNKLQKRYQEYNYSKFEKSDKIYNMLSNKLKEYENLKLGSLKVIHGDCVLTNIMINNLGNILTIYGDEFYDWSKLYQSLIGYDEILENKYISKNYKDKLLKYFSDRIIEKYGITIWNYIQYITASLLFSLIPLHDNDKCKDYFNLIYKILTF